MTKLMASSENSTLAFDLYLELSKKGPAYQRQVALEMWDSLTPSEKRTLQDSARKLAGNDLRFGAEHTQSLLLLKYAVTGTAINTKQTSPVHHLV